MCEGQKCSRPPATTDTTKLRLIITAIAVFHMQE